MSITSALGVVCTVLAFVFIWPQVFRVYRLRSVEGIAPRGTLQGVAGAVLWNTYAIAKWNPTLLVSNVAVVLAFILIGLAQVRHRVLPATSLAGVFVGMSLVGALLAMATPAAVGWVAIAISGTSFVPQTVHVLRSDALHAVSPTMYVMLLATATCWCIYGFLIHDFLVSAPNFIVGPCAAVVAVKATAARRQHTATT